MAPARLAIGLAVLALLGAGAVWHVAASGDGGGTAMTFDPAVWRDEGRIYTDPFPRLAMAEALIAGGTLTGLTRPEVEDRLGPPTETPYFADRDLVYWLSESQRGFGVDSHWLVMDLDGGGRVVRAEIVRD